MMLREPLIDAADVKVMAARKLLELVSFDKIIETYYAHGALSALVPISRGEGFLCQDLCVQAGEHDGIHATWCC